MPTEKGRAISLARAEAAREEAARENEQKQQRELFDGGPAYPRGRVLQARSIASAHSVN